MKLNGSAVINSKDQFCLGGIPVSSLAEIYGTPLMIYDEERIRQQCRIFRNTCEEAGLQYRISYAGKAFLCRKMIRILKEEKMGLDTVSGNEIYTAVSSGLDPAQITFHGNNKTPEEIRYALSSHVGTFVIDSRYEIQLLQKICLEMHTEADCLIRLTPGVEAHTHAYITTGTIDSKFGLSIENGEADRALQEIRECSCLHLRGVHMHIGSQIFDPAGYTAAIEKVCRWLPTQSYAPEIFNIGGGIGICYTSQDHPLPADAILMKIIASLRRNCEKYSLPLPEVWMEPGRSIAGDAGYTVYTVGTIKKIPGIRTYVSVDGGMTDNIRTALYQAKYDAFLPDRISAEGTEIVTIAGKCCESGDILIKDIVLPKLHAGDLLCIPSCGAYHYAMSSNYNLLSRPAVVFVKDGKSELAIRRETAEDLLRLQY